MILWRLLSRLLRLGLVWIRAAAAHVACVLDRFSRDTGNRDHNDGFVSGEPATFPGTSIHVYPYDVTGAASTSF